jgi:L-ascorbate metabolism protein UlaG (beta-lactamase superfamily)
MRVLHLRRRVPLAAAELGDLDGILVSHAHYDHLDLPSLRRLGTDIPVVAPLGVGRLLRFVDDVREVDVGDEVRLGAVGVTATPAEHSSARMTIRSTPSLGYVVSGTRRIYFAGDTDLFEGMEELAGGLDVALLPIGGWGPRLGRGHLDPSSAASATAILRPKVAIPIHWGTLLRIGLGRRRAELLEAPPKRFAAAVADRAPGVAVSVLDPGQSFALGPG